MRSASSRLKPRKRCGSLGSGSATPATSTSARAPRNSSPFADSERHAQILDNLDFTRFTPVPVDHAGLEAQVAEIQRTGIVYDRGEHRKDVRCVSAPIRSEGRIVVALAVLPLPLRAYWASECFTIGVPAVEYAGG
ncbi:IclR family transcriptional regulator domain-containing protein [Pseudarthrobacter siccitolerans]